MESGVEAEPAEDEAEDEEEEVGSVAVSLLLLEVAEAVLSAEAEVVSAAEGVSVGVLLIVGLCLMRLLTELFLPDALNSASASSLNRLAISSKLSGFEEKWRREVV